MRIQVPSSMPFAVAIGATLAVRAADVEARSELRVPGSDSQIALDLLEERFPAFAGISAQVVFHDPAGLEPHETEIVEVLRSASVLDNVTLVSAPFGPGIVSPDRTTTIVTVRYNQGQSDLPGEAYGDLGFFREAIDVVGDGGVDVLAHPAAGDGLVDRPAESAVRTGRPWR